MPTLVIWEWIPSNSTRKQVTEVRARPNPTTFAYGTVYRYDDEKPVKTCSIRARKMPASDIAAEHAKADVANATYIYTMADGRTITGFPVNVTDTLIEGSPLGDITVEILRTDL